VEPVLREEVVDRGWFVRRSALYAELWFGDSAVRIADEFPEAGVLSPQSIGGTPVVLIYSRRTSRRSGSGPSMRAPRSCIQLGDQFWGDRQGQLTDPFGHRWNLAQHVRDVPREEIARAAAAAFGGG
jgi:PhnB protein